MDPPFPLAFSRQAQMLGFMLYSLVDCNFQFKGDGSASFGEDKLGDTGGGVDIGTLDGVLPAIAFFFIYRRKNEQISLQHLMM